MGVCVEVGIYIYMAMRGWWVYSCVCVRVSMLHVRTEYTQPVLHTIEAVKPEAKEVPVPGCLNRIGL